MFAKVIAIQLPNSSFDKVIYAAYNTHSRSTARFFYHKLITLWFSWIFAAIKEDVWTPVSRSIIIVL